MIKNFLNSLEDPKRPLLAPNYWLLRRIGLILPENKFGKIAYIFLHELITFFVITQYIEIYNIGSDLDLLLTNVKISMLSIVCVVKANTFIFWQNSWKEVIEYITEADKYERITRDPKKGKIIDKYTKYCRFVTYSYWVLIIITLITTLNTPLIRFLSSSIYREELRNGTELFPHILSSWMPFDKYKSPGCWITLLWHAGTSTYGAIMMGAYDTNAIVIMVCIGGKLDLLRERSKQMLGSKGAGISDEEAFQMIQQLHDVHVLLIKYARLFNSLLSPVMFLYVIICSLVLCASAYQLTSANDATQKFLMAEYLVFSITQLSIFCWHSNDVLMKSKDIIYGPYESEWWAASVPQRKAIHLLAGQFRVSPIFTAGPFTDLTLATFLSILKGAYSYYTILRE